MTRTVLQKNLFLLAFVTLFVNPYPGRAIANVRSILPDLTGPSTSASTEAGSTLRSVHVANVLDLPVVQQPADEPYYVSDREGEATQFAMASRYGSIGLLAHNTRAGRYFPQLQVGQEVHLVYADGRVEEFVVEQLMRFQALQPASAFSSFRNLDADETLSAGEMFNRAYVGGRRLVFQTCIEAEGNLSWGRLFVVAMPRE